MAGKRELNREANRANLIRVAQDALESNDVDITISNICRAADLAVGTFYNYFESKAELFEEAAITALADYAPYFFALASEPHNDPAIPVAKAMRFSLRLAMYQPRIAKIIVAAGPKAFTRANPFAGPALEALSASVELGFAKCEDPETYFVAFSGAYQNVLAFAVATDAYLSVNADYVVAIFMRELGYDEKTVAEICYSPIDDFLLASAPNFEEKL
ncbi:MAG: TetR/AcrR family transcriptional regulator [Rhodoluna sp.]